MKTWKTRVVVGLVLVCLGAWSLPALAAGDNTNPLGISAKAALLEDVKTGQVLYAYNATQQEIPASLTKLMTFDLALEAVESGRVSMDSEATVSRDAWQLAHDTSVSLMFLEVGKKVTIKDLLYGLVVSSGNDAALVLAEFLGGSEANFVKQMNGQAQKLGLTDTHFVDSNGLSPENRTTAADIAKLARHIILRHPEALTFTSAKSFEYPHGDVCKSPSVNCIRQPNWNQLVITDPSVDGLKTGHLTESGYHLVATAHRGDMRLVSVVLGTTSESARNTQSEKLLDWGFRNFSTVPVSWQQQAPTAVPVYKGRTKAVQLTTAQPVWATVKKGQEGALQVQASLPAYLVAPVAKGQVIGTLTLRQGGQTLQQIPLLAEASVPRGGWWTVIWDSLRLFFRGLIHFKR